METPKVQINSGPIFFKPKIARMLPFQLAVDVSADQLCFCFSLVGWKTMIFLDLDSFRSQERAKHLLENSAISQFIYFSLPSEK